MGAGYSAVGGEATDPSSPLFRVAIPGHPALVPPMPIASEQDEERQQQQQHVVFPYSVASYRGEWQSIDAPVINLQHLYRDRIVPLSKEQGVSKEQEQGKEEQVEIDVLPRSFSVATQVDLEEEVQRQSDVHTQEKKEPSNVAILLDSLKSSLVTPCVHGMTKSCACVLTPDGLGVLSAPWQSHPVARRLKTTICRGLEFEERFRVWFVLSGALRLRARYPPGHYQSLVASLNDEKQKHQDTFADIEKDVFRTFPGENLNEGQTRRLLCCATLFNTTRNGYCQGMNFICGTIQLAFPAECEEEMFWTLVMALDARRACYSTSLCGCVCEARVLSDLISFHQPELFDHVTRVVGLCWDDFFTRWIMTLFSESLPLQNGVFRLWDLYFFYGEKVVFLCALVYLETARDELLLIHTSEVLLDLLFSRLPQLVSFDIVLARLIERLSGGDDDIASIVHTLRGIHSEEIVEQVCSSSKIPSRQAGKAASLFQDDQLPEMYRMFLSQTPWITLVRGALHTVEDFQYALMRATDLFQSPSTNPTRNRIAINGFLSGLTHRLFDLFARADDDVVPFDGFLQLVFLLTKSSRSQRLHFAFDFFNRTDGDTISQHDLNAGLLVFHRLFRGIRGTVISEIELFLGVIHEKLGHKGAITYLEFCSVIALDTLVANFFSLNDLNL